MRSDWINKVYTIEKTYGIEIPDRDQWEQESVKLNGLVYFVDGSKSPNGTGAGVVGAGGPRYGISISLGTEATILQAEIYAILACALALKKRNYRCRIFIVSNSVRTTSSNNNNK